MAAVAPDPHPESQKCEGTWLVRPELGVQANWWLCMQRDGHLQLIGKKTVNGEVHYRVKWGDITQEQEVQYSWEPASALKEFSSDLMQMYDEIEKSRGPGGNAQASTCGARLEPAHAARARARARVSRHAHAPPLSLARALAGACRSSRSALCTRAYTRRCEACSRSSQRASQRIRPS